MYCSPSCPNATSRSLMITLNLVFSEWDRIFKDPMTGKAAIDRLIRHSIILSWTTRATGRKRRAPDRTGLEVRYVRAANTQGQDSHQLTLIHFPR